MFDELVDEMLGTIQDFDVGQSLQQRGYMIHFLKIIQLLS